MRICLAMLTVDRVVITRQQLDEFSAALVLAYQEMEVAMRCGNQAKEISLVYSDEIIW